MKTITIDVSPAGETKITTKGFAGGTCKDATKDLEKALGLTTKDQATAEYYTASTGQQNRVNS